MSYSSKHTGLSLENVIENSLLKNNNTPYTPSGDYDPTTKKYVEEYVTNILQSYVQKVSGKGLSTNDFTNDLMNKLNGLKNYDDTTIKNSVQSLQNSLNTLTQGDATSAIESFNEIIAFLKNTEDTETLDGIIAGINQSISNVQSEIPTKLSQLTNDNNTVRDASYVHTDNNYTSSEKSKLSGIASGAEVNQNAFSNVVVGETTISADSKTDSLTLVAGSNITISPDATNDKITISAKDTTYGAVSSSAAGLMSASDKSKLDGIASGAEVNVQSDWNVTDSSSDAYIKNKPTIPSAVTESTVSGWGFTKNTGTVTGVKINGTSKSPTGGVVDLGTVITSHQDISGKLDSTTAASTYLTKTDAASTYLGKSANAVSATKATQDASGNVITSTYATKAALSGIQTQLDTLVEGNASTAIESFNEIIAFLADVEDTETLDGIIAGINTEIAKKAGKSEAIKSISRSGTTFTATRVDGTTFTFNQQDSNTTYAFEGGTNQFTVTPSGGSAQTVKVTPSISNATTSAAGLMSSSDKSKLDGITSGANAYSLPAASSTTLGGVKTSTGITNSSGTISVAYGTTAGTACQGNDSRLSNARPASDVSSWAKASSKPSYNKSEVGLSNVANIDQSKAIKSISRSGTTFTYTCLDDSTGTFTQQDSNTTYKDMTGATSSAAGASGLVPAPAAGKQGQFLRGDGTWASPANDNTTYTFASGTNSFTVTPKGGSAQTVNVTPSISNNVTYTGTLTDEQVAVFEGTSGQVKASGFTIGKSVPSDAKFTDTNTTYSSGSGISLSGTTFSHADTSSLSGSYGPTANVTGTDGATIVVPQITVDGYGHVTGVTNRTYTSKDSNTTYSAMSASELSTGTAETSRSITAKVLSEYVKGQIDSKIAAADAMIYKGTIGTNGTVTALPNTHSTGWTYKVITAGTYAGKVCEIGDMIICLTDGTAANDDHWTVVQNNIDGAVTGPSSATDTAVAIFNGTSGKVIKNSGFTIGKSVPSNAVFTDTKYSAGNGLTMSGTTMAVGAGTGISVAADTVGLATSGVTAGTYGDDEATRTLTHSDVFDVPQITVDAYGRITSASTKTLTLPASGDTHYTTGINAGASGATSNSVQTNPYITVKDNSTYRSQVRLLGSGATSVKSDASGNITISSTNTTYNIYSKSATTAATAGWYRIATSVAGIEKCEGTFEIQGSVSGKHTTATIIAGTNYGVADSSNISVLHCSHYSDDAINKVRIVYHTTYSGNYAYLEVYNPDAVALTITVKLVNGYGWSLVDPKTAGSVPRGYSNKEAVLANGTIYSEKFSGNGSGLSSLNASNISSGTINASRLPAASTSAQGAMTAAMVTKLNGITDSADSVSFSRSLTSGTKIGTITINGSATDLYCQTNTDTDTHWTTGIAAGGSGATANASTSNPYITIRDNSTHRGQVQIKGGGATTVSSDDNGVITITSTDTNTQRAITDSVSTSNSSTAASATAVKTAYDKAVSAYNLANGKTSNTGTVTSVATGVGLTGGSITTSGTVKAKLRSETALTIDSAAATTTSGRVYPVAVDKTGYLAVNVPWSNTTYSSKSAASGGTDVSLVTTGEKYTWNAKASTSVATTSANGLMSSTDKSKLDGIASGATAVSSSTVSGWGFTKNAGTVTSVSTGVGLTGGSITGSGTIKAKLKSETASTLDSASMGSTSGRQYAVGVDKSGYLSVNVPWTDNNSQYSAGTGLSLSSGAFSVNYGTAAGTACQGNDSRLSNSRPASDVYSWAKAASKPSYSKSEVGLGNVANIDQSKAIKAITRSGTTFTYTCLDGTTGTFTQQDNNTTYSAATTSAAGLMSAADKVKTNRVRSYTTATTVASLNVNYESIYVTLTANASLSASATGADYNGRTITAYVYTKAAQTITIPTTGSYVSMCGSSFTTTAGGWVEFNLTCINGIWHIAKLEQE